MPLSTLPYIEFATEYYINAKADLAKSDVPGTDLSAMINDDRFAEMVKTHPYPLMVQLKEVLAKKYGVSSENVELTIGVTSGFNVITQIQRDLGHLNTLVESPVYEPLWLTPEGNGLEVTFCQRNKEFKYDMDEIKKNIKGKNNWFWITNSHNPTGAYLNPNEIKDIAGVLKKSDSYLYVDEIYHDFFSPLGEDSAVNLGDNVIIANGLTKTYGLGTLKVGWLIGPKDIIHRATIARLHQYMLVPSPSLALTLMLMESIEEIRQAQVDRIAINRSIVSDFFQENSHVTSFLPESGPIGVFKLPEGMNDVELAKKAAKEDGLILAPGHFFKMPGWIRISYAGTEKRVKEGLSLLKKYI